MESESPNDIHKRLSDVESRLGLLERVVGGFAASGAKRGTGSVPSPYPSAPFLPVPSGIGKPAQVIDER